MYSLRRAAVRAAVSTSRVVAARPLVSSFPAIAAARDAVVPGRCAVTAVRCFSQTWLVRNSEDAKDSAAVPQDEDAAEAVAALETEAAADAVASLESEAAADAFAAPESEATTDAVEAQRSEGTTDALSAQAITKSAEAYKEGETPYGLFVRNLVFEATERHLSDAFEKFGKVTKAIIARDARGLSRGYGFLWFENEHEMQSAIIETNGSFWHGRRLTVQQRTAPNESRGASKSPTKTLYIGNIPYETTDTQLNELFRELDNVRDVRVAVDRTTGWPRGFAHADFRDPESCSIAMQKLAGVALGGRQLRLDYAADSPKTRAPPLAEGQPEEV